VWGRESLAELAEDASLHPDWQVLAANLLARYPSIEFLRHFNAADPDATGHYADVLLNVRMLFVRIMASSSCSDRRRNALQVVLRHFP
jgi:hypothetical protein